MTKDASLLNIGVCSSAKCSQVERIAAEAESVRPLTT